jgi:hypothetical protein
LIRRDPVTGDVILSPEKKKKDAWKKYFEMVRRLKAEAPEEFEGFMEDGPKSPPKIRELF